jgi:hypothetical protein
MKARVSLTIAGQEVGCIEEDVADEAAAERFFERMRNMKLRMMAGDRTEEVTPFAIMPIEK